MEGGREGGWEGGGRAGGKTTRRLLARKPSAATPYDRPRPSTEVGAPRERVWREGDEGGGTGWFSKAKQLLRPASRVLPPFFSPFVASSSPSEDLQSPNTSAAPPLEVEQDCHVDITKQAFNSQASHSDETRSPAADDHPKDYSEVDDDAGGRLGNNYNQIGFTDIEKRLKQKTFSRDESNCLIELLRSRTVGLAEDDRYEVGFRASNIGNAWDQKFLRRSIEEKKPVQMDLRVQKERVFDEAGTSPVEIAKAFMESRSSALHHVPRGGIVGADKIPSCDHDSLNPSSVLVARTPQTCWPGAVVQADHRYFTPQSERDRSTLCNIPQNTFSQGSSQKSISKFHCKSERHPSLPFTGWKQSATPIFGTNKERMPAPGDGRTAVPPILGWEHENITSSSKGVTPYHSADSKLLLSTRSDALKGSTSNIQWNVEPGSSKCDIVKHKPACAENDSLRTASGSFRVHPKSSEVARKILEHLDRTVPSPQNKLFESKVPVVKRTLPSASMTKMLNGQDNKHCTGFPNAIFLRGDDVSSGDAKAQKAKEEVSLSFKTNVTDSETPQMQKSLPLCQSFGTDRAFTTLSVSKPENASCFPDNRFGLSFRASMAPSTYCEPLATQTLDQHSSATGGTYPSFDFGPVVGSGPIFSFGSIISSTSIRVADSSVPPYRFGSDNNSRLSFRSFSNDAVCY